MSTGQIQIALNPSRMPMKRPRVDSVTEDSGRSEAGIDEMDFLHTENVTPTQAIGNDADHPEFTNNQLPPPS